MTDIFHRHVHKRMRRSPRPSAIDFARSIVSPRSQTGVYSSVATQKTKKNTGAGAKKKKKKTAKKKGDGGKPKSAGKE